MAEADVPNTQDIATELAEMRALVTKLLAERGMDNRTTTLERDSREQSVHRDVDPEGSAFEVTKFTAIGIAA